MKPQKGQQWQRLMRELKQGKDRSKSRKRAKK